MLRKRTSVGLIVAVVCVLLASGCGLISREEERTGRAGLELQNATGRIQSVSPDSDRFAFIPEDGDRMVFRVNENSAITVGNENAPLDDLRKGQRGTVTYVVRGEDRNIARVVDLRAGDQTTPQEDSTMPEETTGMTTMEETTGF